MDIHNRRRQLERLIERITNEEDFTDENRKIALGLKNDLLSQNIGLAKVGRYLQDVIWLNRNFKKNFKDATVEDIKELVANLNQSEYAEGTKKGIKVMLRKLYKYIRNVPGKNKYPPEVDWYTLTISKCKAKLPEELLTEDEMNNIILAGKCERDRALLATLCESGARVGEIGSMKITSVSLEKIGAKLTIHGKTGARKILVIGCSTYLNTWINHHPFRNNSQYPLWCKTDGNFLTYERINHILKQAVKKAGITKRVHPHLLRHSRATIMANKMTDAQMKHYFGWTQGSNMASIYIHMSGKDTDEAIMNAYGLEMSKEKIIPQLHSITCLRCSKENSPTDKYCNCGFVLDKEEGEKIIIEENNRNKADMIMNRLMEDPEILSLIKKKMVIAS
jgi:integrase/recombinase XerD